MSICRCLIHDKPWDSDIMEECPDCSSKIAELEERRDEFKRFLAGMRKLSMVEHFPRVENMLIDNIKIIGEEIKLIQNKMMG